MTTKIRGLLAVVLLAGPMAAEAALTVYFGENELAAGTVSGDPVTARTNFLSGLTGVGSEGFESYTPGDPFTNPLNVSFFGSTITGKLSGGSFGVVDGNSDCCGRFNTTSLGSNWWLAGEAFSVEFSAPVSAFGFYGTDIGDFNGQLKIRLIDSSDVSVDKLVESTQNGPDGSLLFWGFIDPTATYKKIEFDFTAEGADGFGFDDFVVGDPKQISPVPLPAAAWLLLSGLGGLGFLGRRRKTV